MRHEISFDKINVAESEIDALAAGFEQTKFFDNEGQWFIRIKKIENTYEVFISTTGAASRSPQYLNFFAEQRNEMQNLFPNNKIIFNLFVNEPDNVVKRLE